MADLCTERELKIKEYRKLGDILTPSDYKLKSWDLIKINGITNAKDWINLLKTRSDLPSAASSSSNLFPENVDPPHVSFPSLNRGVYWDPLDRGNEFIRNFVLV